MSQKIVYDVLSPDGFSISRDAMWHTKEEATQAMMNWIDCFRGQGYYTAVGRRIALEDLPGECTIIPIPVTNEQQD